MKPQHLNLVNYDSMVLQFHSESDRGAAVLAGSYVENVLGGYLRFRAVDVSLADALFESNGPLSTYSQRITVAQAYGFIDKRTGDSLNYVRKIRNYFAHHPLDASFDESPVKEWADKLAILLPFPVENKEGEYEMSRRNVYLLSCGIFSAQAHVKMGDMGSHA